MASKPTIVDYQTKLCAAILQPLFDMVWDGLGESPVPADIVTHIGAQPSAPSGGPYLGVDGTWLPLSDLQHNSLTNRDAVDCHPISSITGLEDALSAIGPTDHSGLTGRDSLDSHPILAITDLREELDALAATGGASLQVTQPGHGFTGGSDIGRPMYFNGTTWELARANNSATLGILVIGEVVDANNLILVQAGEITNITIATLTPGATYFVDSNTAGAITTTETSTVGQYSNPILLALTSNSAIILPWRAYEIFVPLPTGPGTWVWDGTQYIDITNRIAEA